MKQNPLPKYIALCGWPGSGKNEVAALFQDLIGARVMDDGEPLRLSAPLLLGFDCDLPYTRSGKASFVDTPSGKIEVRKFLGDIGVMMEDKFGEFYNPWMAVNASKELEEMIGATHFVFPSVRRRQGLYYKSLGGVVIEIHRPGIKPSPHEFDTWDESLVDHVIENAGTKRDLKHSVKLLIDKITSGQS